MSISPDSQLVRPSAIGLAMHLHGLWGDSFRAPSRKLRWHAAETSALAAQGMIALAASPTAYSAAPGSTLTESPALAGSAVGLAALVQTRNHARVAVVGSVELFSDDFYRTSVPVNGRCVVKPSVIACSRSRSCARPLDGVHS